MRWRLRRFLPPLSTVFTRPARLGCPDDAQPQGSDRPLGTQRARAGTASASRRRRRSQRRRVQRPCPQALRPPSFPVPLCAYTHSRAALTQRKKSGNAGEECRFRGARGQPPRWCSPKLVVDSYRLRRSADQSGRLARRLLPGPQTSRTRPSRPYKRASTPNGRAKAFAALHAKSWVGNSDVTVPSSSTCHPASGGRTCSCCIARSRYPALRPATLSRCRSCRAGWASRGRWCTSSSERHPSYVPPGCPSRGSANQVPTDEPAAATPRWPWSLLRFASRRASSRLVNP
jgi:hypothetical protein